jgi:hypothetical protein
MTTWLVEPLSRWPPYLLLSSVLLPTSIRGELQVESFLSWEMWCWRLMRFYIFVTSTFVLLCGYTGRYPLTTQPETNTMGQSFSCINGLFSNSLSYFAVLCQIKNTEQLILLYTNGKATAHLPYSVKAMSTKLRHNINNFLVARPCQSLPVVDPPGFHLTFFHRSFWSCHAIWEELSAIVFLPGHFPKRSR